MYRYALLPRMAGCGFPRRTMPADSPICTMLEETTLLQHTLQELSDLKGYIRELSVKVDEALKAKLDIQYYRDRHDELVHRVDILEAMVQKINETISNLHNSSMSFVTDALGTQRATLAQEVQELERRLIDKMEANSKFSRSQGIIIGIAVIGWILGILGSVIAFIR